MTKSESILNEPLSQVKETVEQSLQAAKEQPKDEEIYSKSTLFVTTIPYDATNLDLEEFFSEIGPVRSAFIIMKKDGSGSTGCGYVQYVLAQDAQKALTTLKKKKFKGLRTLKIDFALKKGVVEKRKELGEPLNLKEIRQKRELGGIKKKIKKDGGSQPAGESSYLDRSRTVLISDLPPGLEKSTLKKKFRKVGDVESIVTKESDDTIEVNSAKVVYVDSKAAQRACKKFNDHIYKGTKIKCVKIKTVNPNAISKKNRLIVRNLAFGCKKENLEKVFEVFGPISECKIPAKADGKAPGFGFVQFERHEDAEKAVEALNGQKILNRIVAVDWAISKKEYDKLAEEEAEQEESEKNIADERSEEQDEGETEDFEMANDRDEPIEKEEQDKVKVDEDNDLIIYDNDEPIMIDDDDEIPLVDEVEKPQTKDDKEDELARTLFIRNIPFETKKAELAEKFKPWGQIQYALITKDKVTNLSKGNGFVCFVKLEDMQKILKTYTDLLEFYEISNEPEPDIKDKDHKKKSNLKPSLPESSKEKLDPFTIDGRLLNISKSVSKKDANRLTLASNLQRRKGDKRNLYLLKEGAIFPDSEAAKLITAEELEKRTAQYANTKRVLTTNPNLFLSRTRLAFKGLDLKFTDSDLKKLAKEGAVNFWKQVEAKETEPLEEVVIDEEVQDGLPVPGPSRKIIIKQAKIIKDSERLDPVTKKPKSKGYGFVEFQSHADALCSLRNLNNKVLDGSKKRLIVTFAVENRLVLKKREQREINSQKKEKSEIPTSKKISKKEMKDKKKGKKLVTEGTENNEQISAQNQTQVDKVAISKKTQNQSERLTKKQQKKLAKKMAKKGYDPKKEEEKKEKMRQLKLKRKEKYNKNKKATNLPKAETKDNKVQKKNQQKSEDSKFQNMVKKYTSKLINTNTDTSKEAMKKWYD